MKVLELFAGTEGISNAFREEGHESFSIDADEQFPCSWNTDISKITTQDILDRFGVPDMVWIGTPCESYSIAAISHHRRKNPETGNLDGVSPHAIFCDAMNWHVRKIVEELQELNPNLIYFWENPRGGFRKMDFIQGIPRYTITYCKFGDKRMKPTDIFTNHPDPQFPEPCKNGDPCHERAPRGSKTGTQGLKNAKTRSEYPKALCKHIVNIMTHLKENNNEQN